MKAAAVIVVLAAIAIGAIWLRGAQAADSTPPADPHVTALRWAIEKGAGYCDEWLDTKDFKSLARDADGLVILCEALSSRGGEPSNTASSRLIATARALATAARQRDATSCREVLRRLLSELDAAANQQPGGELRPEAVTKPDLRSLMYLMDGLYAEAKIGLAAGNARQCKNSVLVLSDVGQLVLHYGQDRWPSLAKDFITAADSAAAGPDDPAVLRPLLLGVGQRCEACHDNR